MMPLVQDLRGLVVGHPRDRDWEAQNLAHPHLTLPCRCWPAQVLPGSQGPFRRPETPSHPLAGASHLSTTTNQRKL